MRHLSVFLAAIALIAIHVIDDSFVQPEPGTAAANHLLSGLLPLAALAGAAAAYPRVRPGARASIALVAGLFGIAAGVEGWHYTLEAEPSGDDYTSLLSLPAGVVLVLLAVVTLWRSRKREGGRLRRYARRALIGLGALIVGVSVIAPFLLSYITTHVARAYVPAPALGGADFEDVRFETADGRELRGWYIPSLGGAAVIAYPGRAGPRTPARFLARAGYGVLLFDRSGEGESEGDPNAFGWGGVDEIEAALAFLRGRPDVDPARIGGIGLSVGGEVLLEAAAEDDALKAVVSEGAGIRSVREARELDGAERWAQLPTWAAQTLGTAIFANAAPPPSLKDLVARITPRPVFLIYAERGQGGEELNPEYFAAAGQPKRLWRTESGHTGGHEASPRRYERRVLGFFQEALGG